MPTEGVGFVNPIGLGFTLLMGVLLLVLPRRYALLPIIALTCFMPLTQRLIVVGLNFHMIRILALFAFARVLLRKELGNIKLNAIDKALLCWALFAIVMHTLLWQTWGEFINRLGYAYDAVGFYFVFRSLILDLEDITRVFKITALFIVPLALAMLFEHVTAHNLFIPLGGHEPEVRNGIVRARGPFVHPDLSGSFGATLLPFFVALWWLGDRTRAFMGIVSSTIITFACGASGPVVSFLAGVLALSMWPLRKRMRQVRWGIVFMLIGLQMVMKAPVWWAIMHVSIHAGGDSYQRAYIIDRAIMNFRDWWLVGIKDTEVWGYGLHDITNEFILQGTEGGLLTMLLFILIIKRCFGAVGRSLRAVGPGKPATVQFALWALGSALFAHVATFFGVSYFDQSFVNLYMLLAIISTAYCLFVVARSSNSATISTEFEGRVGNVLGCETPRRNANAGQRLSEDESTGLAAIAGEPRWMP
jgi:hypothetical protein